MSTQQALTIAISPSGLPKLFDALIVSGSAFAAGLDSQTPPDQSLNIGQVPDTDIDEYVVSLTSGSFSGASAVMNSVNQQGPGSSQFTLNFTVAITASFGSWTESGRYARSFPHGGGVYYIRFGPADVGSFSFQASAIALSTTINITQSSGAWAFSFVSANSNASNATLNFTIPSGSALAPYQGACSGQQQIYNAIESSLESLDYSSAVQRAVTPILKAITESGQLTPAIVFEWTPNTFVFPEVKNTLESGVTGIVTYNGTPFPPPAGVTPPNLSLPSVPTSFDLQLFAADYLFSSLYWAYFEAGQLTQTITPSMLAEPSQLNTSNFKKSITSLFQTYPNCNMDVVVAQSTAPLITFVPGYSLPPPYILTPQAMATLQGTLPVADYQELQNKMEDEPYTSLTAFQTDLATYLGNDCATYQAAVVAAATTPTVGLEAQLGATIYIDLMGITGLIYLTQADYIAVLQNAIGSSNTAKYQQMLCDAAATFIAVLNHNPQCTFNVQYQGNYIELFVIQIAETDFLTNFVLGESGSAVTIQSEYQIWGNPTATLVSSNFSGVNAGDFANLWQYVLSGVYASIMQRVASTGVPVPFIQGYTFQKSTISLQSGYASLIADILFNQ